MPVEDDDDVPDNVVPLQPRGSPRQFRTYGADIILLDDVGIAERWIERSPLAENWRQVHGRGWAEWQERVGWTIHADGQPVLRDVRQMLSTVYNFFLAATPSDNNEAREAREALARFRPASLGRTIVSILEEHRTLVTESNDWDPSPHLLGLPEGKVVDLRNGAIRDQTRDDKITRRSPYTPVDLEEALAGTPTCHRWTSFLHQIMEGEDDRIQFLQRWSGYSLTGETTEQSMLFLYGSGANGKSVFLSVAAGVLGSASGLAVPGYYATIDSEVLMAKRGGNGTVDYVMAELASARAVIVSEVPQNASWDLGLLKKLVDSHADITARSPYGRPFSYRPKFKLLVAGNERPSLRGAVGQAIARRIHLLGFNYRIPDDQQDRRLPEHLLETEGGMILSWMIAGAVEWYRRAEVRGSGLEPPQVVVDAVREYMDDEDSLGQFLREKVRLMTPAEVTRRRETMGLGTDWHATDLSARDIFPRWKTWAEEAGIWVGSEKSLAMSLAQRTGWVRAETAGKRLWVGARWLEDRSAEAGIGGTPTGGGVNERNPPPREDPF